MPQDALKRFLSEQEVEREYGFAKATTLRRWRLYGNKGPRWRKLQGAVRYDRADIEAWIAACPAGGVNAPRPGAAV